MSSLRKIIKVVLALLIAVGLFIYVRSSPHLAQKEPRTPIPGLPSPFPFQTPSVPAPAPLPPVSPRPPEKPKALENFQKKFGTALAIEFSKEGFLVSAKRSENTRGGEMPRFDPSDAAKALARAQEIIEEARELLGLQQDLPLSQPKVRGDEFSAHAFFQETWNGLPLAPLGTLTLDLGRSGELLGLYSTVVRNLKVTNQKKLSIDQARPLAEASLRASVGAQAAPPFKTEGGRLLIWVIGETGLGRHAYEFSVQGHQIVVDAESGEILSQRDRRKF